MDGKTTLNIMLVTFMIVLAIPLALADPGQSSKLMLKEGSLNGQAITPEDRIVQASPEEVISGTVTLEWESAWPREINQPFGYTTGWGDHETSYGTFGIVSGNGSTTEHISVTAPSTPGIHYLIFAYRAEIDPGDVFSMTNWDANPEMWNDGNDIAGWSEDQIVHANAQGRVTANLLLNEGMAEVAVPTTAIAIEVMEQSDHGGACAERLMDIPASCTGGVLDGDEHLGSCRSLSCAGQDGAIQVLACEKPDDADVPQYFEMYRQEYSGTPPQVCLGEDCIQNEGYVRGSDFPVCGEPQVCTPAEEVCDGIDNDCDGYIDEGGVCCPPDADTCEPDSDCTDSDGDGYAVEGGMCGDVDCDDGNADINPGATEVCNGVDDNCSGDSDADVDEGGVCESSPVSVSLDPHFPQDHNYVFICEAEGFTPTSYEWDFGDGEVETHINETRLPGYVWHTFAGNGTKTVTCTASDGTSTASGSMAVEVHTLLPPERLYGAYVSVEHLGGARFESTCNVLGFEPGYSSAPEYAFTWHYVNHADPFPTYNIFKEGKSSMDMHTFPDDNTYTLHCDTAGADRYRPEYYDDGFIPCNSPRGCVSTSADVTLAVDVPDDVCYGDVRDIPPECYLENAGHRPEFLKDEIDGSCRTIICRNNDERSNAVGVVACNEPGNEDPQYFEMVRDFGAGDESVEICLAGTCLGNEGPANATSESFPVCVGDEPGPVCGNGVVEEGEQCDDGNTANGDGCSSTCMDESGACFDAVAAIPAECSGGEITQDVASGSCRTILCGGLQVLACDKPDAATPEYFEMYKQSSAEGIEICIAETCISDNGFAKSADYPICTGSGQDPVCGNGVVEEGEQCDDGNTASGDGCNGVCEIEDPSSCTDSDGDGYAVEGGMCGDVDCNDEAPGINPGMSEICNGVDDDCDGMTDEGDVCGGPPDACNSVADVSASCGEGEIVEDVMTGCRSITCAAGSRSTKVLACDKPDSTNPEYFEMYLTDTTGETIKVCLGDTCVGSVSGFARSDGFVCEGARVDVVDGFPQEHNYAFSCNAGGFDADSYDWDFGDGTVVTDRSVNDVFHSYGSSGDFTVTCTARNGEREEMGSVQVSVAAPDDPPLGATPFRTELAFQEVIMNSRYEATCGGIGYQGSLTRWNYIVNENMRLLNYTTAGETGSIFLNRPGENVINCTSYAEPKYLPDYYDPQSPDYHNDAACGEDGCVVGEDSKTIFIDESDPPVAVGSIRWYNSTGPDTFTVYCEYPKDIDCYDYEWKLEGAGEETLLSHGHYYIETEIPEGIYALSCKVIGTPDSSLCSDDVVLNESEWSAPVELKAGVLEQSFLSLDENVWPQNGGRDYLFCLEPQDNPDAITDFGDRTLWWVRPAGEPAPWESKDSFGFFQDDNCQYEQFDAEGEYVVYAAWYDARQSSKLGDFAPEGRAALPVTVTFG